MVTYLLSVFFCKKHPQLFVNVQLPPSPRSAGKVLLKNGWIDGHLFRVGQRSGFLLLYVSFSEAKHRIFFLMGETKQREGGRNK